MGDQEAVLRFDINCKPEPQIVYLRGPHYSELTNAGPPRRFATIRHGRFLLTR
jgi:hypothetical protein